MLHVSWKAVSNLRCSMEKPIGAHHTQLMDSETEFNYVLTDFLSAKSISDREVLKLPTMIGDLSLFP